MQEKAEDRGPKIVEDESGKRTHYLGEVRFDVARSNRPQAAKERK